jgi:hypothetical protein
MAQRAARVAEAVRLRRDFGMTDAQIALQIGVSSRTIKRYFSETLAQWRKAVPLDVMAARAQSDRKLQRLLAKCMAEYEKSKQPLKKTVEEREAVEGVPWKDWPITKVKTEIVERCGDVRFISEARALIQEHCKLFGLHKPVPQEVDVHGELRAMTVFGLVQLAEEAARPENLPTIVSADGRIMVRGPDGVPRLPEHCEE